MSNKVKIVNIEETINKLKQKQNLKKIRIAKKHFLSMIVNSLIFDYKNIHIELDDIIIALKYFKEHMEEIGFTVILKNITRKDIYKFVRKYDKFLYIAEELIFNEEMMKDIIDEGFNEYQEKQLKECPEDYNKIINDNIIEIEEQRVENMEDTYEPTKEVLWVRRSYYKEACIFFDRKGWKFTDFYSEVEKSLSYGISTMEEDNIEIEIEDLQ